MAKRKKAPRSIWNGAVSFAGIDVPVKVHGATDPQSVQFRELHEPDGAEVAHELVDSDGHEVDRDQVVRGYEVRSGEYVVLDDDEMKAAAAPKRKTVAIECFVPREQIEPGVYDRPYYLSPQDGGEEGYAIVVAALRKTGRVGVGRVVLRSREQLAALLEVDGMLRMHTLRFADELVDADSLDVDSPRKKAEPRLERMAVELLDGLTGSFQPGRYKDTYRERVLALVERKAKGEEIDLEQAAAPEPSEDLMDALEASLKAAKG